MRRIFQGGDAAAVATHLGRSGEISEVTGPAGFESVTVSSERRSVTLIRADGRIIAPPVRFLVLTNGHVVAAVETWTAAERALGEELERAGLRRALSFFSEERDE